MILYLGVFFIRDIVGGDRWPLFQKCKVAEHLVFIEFNFLCCDIFFQMERMFLTSTAIYICIHTYSYTSECSRQIFREISRDILSRS